MKTKTHVNIPIRIIKGKSISMLSGKEGKKYWRLIIPLFTSGAPWSQIFHSEKELNDFLSSLENANVPEWDILK